MTGRQTPGYFVFTNHLDEPPEVAECLEGRLLIADDRIVCAVNGEISGYAGRVDEYSNSTIRKLFGNRFDPQEFDIDEAVSQDETEILPYNSIVGASLVTWEGSELRGADHSYGIHLERPHPNKDLLLQLGRGNRNRGAGKTRHEAVARTINERATATAASNTPSHSESESLDEDKDSMSWMSESSEKLILEEINNQDTPLKARVGILADESTHFLEELQIVGGDIKEFDEIPEQQSFEVGCVTSDGRKEAAEFNQTNGLADVQVNISADEITIDTPSVSTTTGSDQTITHNDTASEKDGNVSESSHSTSVESLDDSEQSQSSDETNGPSVIRAVGLIVLGIVLLQVLPAFLATFFMSSVRSIPSDFLYPLIGIATLLGGGSILVGVGLLLYRLIQKLA